MAMAVNDLVMEPIRKRVVPVFGSCWVRSAYQYPSLSSTSPCLPTSTDPVKSFCSASSASWVSRSEITSGGMAIVAGVQAARTSKIAQIEINRTDVNDFMTVPPYRPGCCVGRLIVHEQLIKTMRKCIIVSPPDQQGNDKYD